MDKKKKKKFLKLILASHVCLCSGVVWCGHLSPFLILNTVDHITTITPQFGLLFQKNEEWKYSYFLLQNQNRTIFST